MTIRLFGALLCGAAFMLATQTDLAQAQKDTGAATRATTVKSSKSNTSDRMGGGGGKGGTQRFKLTDGDFERSTTRSGAKSQKIFDRWGNTRNSKSR